jgi:hypothetical protein
VVEPAQRSTLTSSAPVARVGPQAGYSYYYYYYYYGCSYCGNTTMAILTMAILTIGACRCRVGSQAAPPTAPRRGTRTLILAINLTLTLTLTRRGGPAAVA